MPSDVRMEPAVVRFTKKAPAKIAGQKRSPKRSRVTMAIPVGGQKGLALGCTVAKRKLSFAARIYVAQAATPIRSCFRESERHNLRLRSIRVREVDPGTGFRTSLTGNNRAHAPL